MYEIEREYFYKDIRVKGKIVLVQNLEGEESKQCKRVKKYAVKKSIANEDYKKCLFTGTEQLRKMYTCNKES